MSYAFIVAQLVLLALAYVPGMSVPARGAFLLASFWCFGGYIGSILACRKEGR